MDWFGFGKKTEEKKPNTSSKVSGSQSEKSGSSSVWNFLGVGNSSEADRKVDPSSIPNYSNACKLGNLKLLKELLVDKSVNPAEHNNSPIRIACEYGHEKIVALLLTDKRVDPTALDNQALRAASENGHAAVIKLLVADRRVNVAAKNNEAIYWVSKGGHEECVRLLLATDGVDPACQSNRALVSACENGHLGVVKLLLAHDRVNPGDDANSCLKLAAENGHTEIVGMLLKDTRVDPFVGEAGELAFKYACENGHHEVVKLLLEDGRTNLRVRGSSGLKKAASLGFDRIVQLLLDYNVDPSIGDNCCIRRASENGHLAVVKALLTSPLVDPTADNSSALVLAAANGYAAVVKCLLEDGRVDPVVDNNKPMAEALKHNHGAVVSALLANRKVFDSFEFHADNELSGLLFKSLADVQRQTNAKKDSIEEKDKNISGLFADIESLNQEIVKLQGLVEAIEKDTENKNITIAALVDDRAKTCLYLKQVAGFLQTGRIEQF